MTGQSTKRLSSSQAGHQPAGDGASVPMPCTKCGACCIAPSITTLMPNMPTGKPAGVRCVNLSDENLCMLYGRPERPAFCAGWKPSPEVCGESFAQAMKNIAALEAETATEALTSLKTAFEHYE